MKKSLGSLIALNRKALLMLGVTLSLAVFGIATWRTSAWSVPGSSSQPAYKGDAEAVRFLEEQISNGNFELMSSAKQMQLQLKAGMKYEDGVLKEGIPNDVRPYKNLFDTKRIEALAESQSILAALANPLVNNPAADTTAQVTQSESTILNINGTNLVASYNDSGSFLGGVNSFTGYSTTTDSGATWIDRGIVPLLGQQNFGDPVLARSAATGSIFLATLSGGANGMNCYKSTDNGVTFTTVANCAPGAVSDGTDKEWIAVDNFAGGGNGNVYHTYRDFGAPNGVFFTRSTDDGNTYSAPILIDSGADGNVQGPFVVVGADHAVYVIYYDSAGAPDTLKVRKSIDLGLTFAPAVVVANLVTTGTNGSLNVPAGYRSSAFPSCAVNPVNANMLACVHGDVTAAGGPNSNIIYNQSTDGGATWSANLQLNTDAGTNAQTHPAMAWMPDGSALSASWQDSRADAANRRVQRFGVIGTVAGAVVTFGPNFQISQPNWAPSFGADPVVNAVYMGDYDTMDADNSFFYSTFTDCRLQPPSGQDVRFARIPKAGPGAIIGFSSSNVTTLNPANNSCTDLFVTLANNGTADAPAVTANFTTTTPGVTLTQNTGVAYGTITAGGTAVNAVPIKMSVANSFVCGTTIVINVTASTGETFSFNVSTQGLGYAVTTQTGQTINGGTVNVGNAGDDVVTSNIALPFPFSFDGVNRTTINVSSNGNAQFTSANTAFTNVCPLPSATMNNLLAAHWDDLRTDRAGGGIFTSTTGTAPNRVFNIEWRAVTFSTPESPIVYEIRLYETGGIIEYVYSNVTGNATNTNGSSASVGLQQNTGVGAGAVTPFSCNTASLSNGFLVRFTPVTACPQGQGECPVGNSADLSITKTDGVTTVTPGQNITYTIVATNNGPSAVTGATVTDNFVAAISTPAPNWTCVGAGGGTCTAAGSGNISDTVNLPVGASVTYTVNATVSPGATFGFSNTATVTAPVGTTDPVPSNNSARDTDAICPPPVTTYNTVEALPVAIPDNVPAGINRTFNVSGLTANLAAVQVRNVTWSPLHTWGGDITVRLSAPGGAPIATIHERRGRTTCTTGAGSSDDLVGPYNFGDAFVTNFHPDGAPNPVPAGDYRASQCVTTAGELVALNTVFGGLTPAQANGTWTLNVSDNAVGDTGSISAVQLQLTTTGGGGCTPTAAGVTVSGRVLTPDGRGLRNAIVTITDSTGMTRTARSSSFGYYTFEGIEVGGTYVISVGSKRYAFTPRTLTVNDAVSDLDFTAQGSE